MVAICIPSVLYVMQNSLVVVALSNLSAPLFQVAYQCKLLTTALVSCLLLGRRYSIQQWISLASLGLGVAIVVLGETTRTTTTATTNNSNNNMILGLTAVMIGCVSSAFAGVGLEMVLKNKQLVPPTNHHDDTSSFATTTSKEKEPPSLWMRNIQMAGISVLIALIQNGLSYHFSSNYNNDNTIKDVRKLFLHGFNSWVWVLVLLQAGGGMLVAAIIKYADNVLKGLATGVSVVVATAASMILFHTPLTRPFVMGATIILMSVYLFSNPII
jgi:UDP-sugar transporter A1/2/3